MDREDVAEIEFVIRPALFPWNVLHAARKTIRAHRHLDGARARLGLGPVTPRPDVTDLAPGQVRAGKKEVLVGTATHAVRLGDVAPVGKKQMPAADWARGARLPEELVLGAEVAR